MKICFCYETFNTKDETYKNLWSDECDYKDMEKAKKNAVAGIKTVERMNRIVDAVHIMDVSSTPNYLNLFTYEPQTGEWEKNQEAA